MGQIVLLTLIGLPLPGATLERLSLDDMIGKSTSIVRGKVAGSYVAQSGQILYTHYTVQVSERFKGQAQSTVDVVVPGGERNGVRQSVPGAPEFKIGEDLVFFLWTGRNGLAQIIGLTQGLFTISAGSAPADPMATRSASHELMLDRSTGQPVKDQTLVMKLSELRSRIAGTLAKDGAAK